MTTPRPAPRRLIVGMSGASGAIFGVRTLQALRAVGGVETHLILSAAARRTLVEETDWTAPQVEALADVVHDHRDIGASIASGSYRTDGMVVAPCSVKTCGRCLMLWPRFKVTVCDLKAARSAGSSRNMKSGGKRSMLRCTA